MTNAISTEPALAEDDEAALNAYLALLKSKGAPYGNLTKRKHFLKGVLRILQDIEKEKQRYDAVIKDKLKEFALSDTKLFFHVTARDFYPFWAGDLRTIARMNASATMCIEPVRLQVNGTLPEILDMLLTLPPESFRTVGLKPYLLKLREMGHLESTINAREIMVMILLWVLKEHPITSDYYRAGVDAVSDLFPSGPPEDLLVCIREFYYYWLEDKTAGANIVSLGSARI